MSRIAHANASLSNSGPARACSISVRVVDLATALWPRKTALELSAKTGRSERMCRYWLARRFKLDADDLASLIRSDHGLEFLDKIMGDAKPEWWRAFKTLQEIAALRRAQEENRSRLESLERVIA